MQTHGSQGTAPVAPGEDRGDQPRATRPTAHRFVVTLLLIVIGALGLRVVYVLTVTQNDHRFYDSYYYAFEAVTIGKGQGIIDPVLTRPLRPNADHPPLTSVILVPVAKLTDGSQLAMRLTMAVIGALAVLAIALVAREIAGDRAALLAALLAAVYPNLWMNDGLIMAETLSALMVALAILLAYRLLRRPSWGAAIGLGFVCGLGMLTRAELALLIPLVAIPACLVAAARSLRQRMALAGAVALVAALAISPWVIRNLTTFDRPVFLSSGDGLVLLGANCRQTYGGNGLGFWDVRCARAGRARSGDVSVSSDRQRRLALDYMKAHPGRLALTAAARVGRVWNLYAPIQMADLARGEGRPEGVSLLGVVMFYLFFPIAVAGAVVLRRRRVRIFPLVGPFVLVTVTVLVFYGWVRFRVPAEVALVVLVAVALDAWISKRAGIPTTTDGTGARLTDSSSPAAVLS